MGQVTLSRRHTSCFTKRSVAVPTVPSEVRCSSVTEEASPLVCSSTTVKLPPGTASIPLTRSVTAAKQTSESLFFPLSGCGSVSSRSMKGRVSHPRRSSISEAHRSLAYGCSSATSGRYRS